MSALGFVTTTLIASALAHLGDSNNKEAEKRNTYSKAIVDFCNEYIRNAQAAVDQRRKRIDEILNYISQLKLDSIEDLFGEYLDTLKNELVNFDVNEDVEGSFEYENELIPFKKMVEMIEAFKKVEIRDCDGNFKDDSIQLSLSVLGVSILGSSVISGVTEMLIGRSFTLLHAIPLSFGVGFAVTGLMKNYEAKKNYENAKEFYEKTKRFSEQVNLLCDNLDRLLKYLVYIGENLRLLTLSFANYVFSLKCSIEDYQTYENEKIDARKLSKKERIMLKNSYIFAQIVYASYDLPLLTEEGMINEESARKLVDNSNLAADLIQSSRNV